MADKPAIRPDVAVGDALKAVARDTLSDARRALEDRQKPDAIAVHDRDAETLEAAGLRVRRTRPTPRSASGVLLVQGVES